MAELLVLCTDCSKEFRSSELAGMRCRGCRVRRACEANREALTAYIKKRRRYASSGAIANEEQFIRLQRRLFSRVIAIVPDPARAGELFDREFQAAMKAAPMDRFLSGRDERTKLFPELRQLKVVRDRSQVQ